MANYNLNAILSVTNKFTQPLNQFKQQISNVQKTTHQANKSMRDFTSNSKGIDNLVSKFKNLAISIGGITGIKKIFDSASEMEGYRNTLNVVMKDTELAGKKIKEAKEFANKTPFETDEIVAGMVKLESYGISSSNEVMTAVGDMAGVMNKSFDQAVDFCRVA